MKQEKWRRDNIILIGFMGSGKTSVGTRLSFKLRRQLQDTDWVIEHREGRSINTIFATEGEAYFREKETELLREYAHSMRHKILSVGGGTPLREENRELLRKIGTVYYLRAQPTTVFARLEGDRTRPLLACADPLARICSMMEERQEIYEAAADVIVDVDELETDEVMKRILKGP